MYRKTHPILIAVLLASCSACGHAAVWNGLAAAAEAGTAAIGQFHKESARIKRAALDEADSKCKPIASPDARRSCYEDALKPWQQKRERALVALDKIGTAGTIAVKVLAEKNDPKQAEALTATLVAETAAITAAIGGAK